MPRFKCINGNCSLKDKEIIVEKVRFVFNNHSKTLEPSPSILCKECSDRLENIPTGNTKGFCFNKFDSLTTSEKRQMLHKRSMNHFQKKDKGDLANYKQKIINDNKKMWEGK